MARGKPRPATPECLVEDYKKFGTIRKVLEHHHPDLSFGTIRNMLLAEGVVLNKPGRPGHWTLTKEKEKAYWLTKYPAVIEAYQHDPDTAYVAKKLGLGASWVFEITKGAGVYRRNRGNPCYNERAHQRLCTDIWNVMRSKWMTGGTLAKIVKIPKRTVYYTLDLNDVPQWPRIAELLRGLGEDSDDWLERWHAIRKCVKGECRCETPRRP